MLLLVGVGMKIFEMSYAGACPDGGGALWGPAPPVTKGAPKKEGKGKEKKKRKKGKRKWKGTKKRKDREVKST